VMHVHMIFMPRVAMGGNVRKIVHNLFATNIFCICPYFSIESKIILDVSHVAVPVCWICREETKETRGQRLSLGIVHVVAHFAHWTCLVLRTRLRVGAMLRSKIYLHV